MTEKEDFCRELVLSLPPLESREFTMLKGHLKKIDGFQEDFLQDVTARTCYVAGDDASDSFIDGLRQKLKEYQEFYNDKGVTARFAISKEGNDIVIKTYAELLNPNNCETGYWSAEWKVQKGKDTQPEMSGTISTHVYYYEDGNVQMRGKRDFEATTVMGADLAQEILTKIGEYEKTFLADLSDEEAVVSSLKQIRRILPITRTRMKWYVQRNVGFFW